MNISDTDNSVFVIEKELSNISYIDVKNQLCYGEPVFTNYNTCKREIILG